MLVETDFIVSIAIKAAKAVVARQAQPQPARTGVVLPCSAFWGSINTQIAETARVLWHCEEQAGPCNTK
jgi:hypothetical protein